MRPTVRRASVRPLLAALSLFAAPALAREDDSAVPYPDDEQEQAAPVREKGRRRYQDDLREVTEDEQERERPMAPMDDPALGLAGELVGGVMLLDGSRGALDPRPAFGLRFTWELGRTLGEQLLHEGLFLDVGWLWSGLRQGTKEVFGDTNVHAFTLAPAFGLQLGGEKSPVVAFAQLGGGLAYQDTRITAGGTATDVGGVKPLLQYGVGIRGRPEINDNGLRLSFRVELTRYRRQYMDDTFLGAALGLDY
ncbi:MAG: hypothetical protein RL653_1615 [Pseudomonadota bacterium]|jgi:hypothetical protein